MERLALGGRMVPCAPSPNHGPRPEGMRPEVIVLHSTECSFGSALRWLCHRESEVSAHFLVGRDGKVVQLVSLDRVAWHAGVSAWKNRERVNRFSIGIEMEHFDGREEWPEVQVRAVVALCRALMERFAIPIEHIVSHAAVARPQGRKVDPVNFPWARLRELAHVDVQRTIRKEQNDA